MTTLGEIQESIADIGIPGVRRVYTGADAPREVYARDLPLLMPDPVRPIDSVRSERLTLGGAGWARIWALNYVCLVSEIGAGRAPRDYAERTAQVMDYVQAALCDWRPADVHSVGPIVIGDIGVLQDAVSAAVDPQRARQFHGFTVQVTLTTSY